MKESDFYAGAYGADSEDAVFDVLLNNLKPGNMAWNYFVDWDKVLKNADNLKSDLEILNSLIGRDDFDEAFRALVQKHPSIVQTLPALAVRVGSGTDVFEILADYEKGSLLFERYDFTKYDENDIDKYLSFLEGTGIKKMLKEEKIHDLNDYMVGVEAGLDSNTRKNRSGIIMENIVEIFVGDFCKKNSYAYIKEAGTNSVKEAFGYDVPMDRQNRRYDFVVNDGKGPIAFEVNFYNSKSGSKLKATAGEYTGLHALLRKNGIRFVWVTDGPGWLSAKAGLREAFHAMDYIFNLDMLENGVLAHEFGVSGVGGGR